MEYGFLKDLAILLLGAKLMGLAARKLKAPQVVGEILAGLILGPAVLGIVEMNETISVFAEIGVILMMFSTGLGTNLKELVRTGPVAAAMACVGVAVPLVCGTLLYIAFHGFDGVGTENFYRAVFIGTIMTATSVSITVATLQELGKLKTELGTTIVSAAVIDDVIGILILTCVISVSSKTGASITGTLVRTALFFVVAIGGGFVINRLMEALDRHKPHTQRLTIISLAFCFIMAYVAETYFGIADITGAYAAGVALCNVDDASYIERRVDIGDYLFFSPVFLAGVGLKTEISGLTPTMIIFCICFVLVALVTKIIGCGAVAKIAGFNWSDSAKAGIGMMTRGEVALIVSQKGLAAGLFDQKYFTAVILLILVSSICTPFALKMVYNRDDAKRSVAAPADPQ